MLHPSDKTNATRDKLLNQGVSVFIERGYHGTGIKEILDPVNVPKGSFYNYFKSKEEFGAEIIRHFAAGLDRLLDGKLKQGDAGLSGLREFFAEVTEMHEERRLGCLVGNLGAELGGASESCRLAMAAALHGWRDRFAAALTRAQEDGTVRKDLPAEDLADFLIDAFEGALIRMKIENSTDPLKKFRSLVLDDFFKA